jgi:hypothetical protein
MGRINLWYTLCLKNIVCRIDPLFNTLLCNSYGIENLMTIHTSLFLIPEGLHAGEITP